MKANKVKRALRRSHHVNAKVGNVVYILGPENLVNNKWRQVIRLARRRVLGAKPTYQICWPEL